MSSGQIVYLVHMKKAVKGWRTRILCALYWDVCRIGIACSVIWKVFTLNVFHITYNRCDQFMFAANNKVMVRQNILIFHMHRQRNLFLCCYDANWYFSFLIHWMKINFCWSQNCITFLQGFNAGSCKLCKNMRWIFGILGFIKFEMCCVYVSLSIQWLRISWKELERNGWTLQIAAFVIQGFC